MMYSNVQHHTAIQTVFGMTIACFASLTQQDHRTFVSFLLFQVLFAAKLCLKCLLESRSPDKGVQNTDVFVWLLNSVGMHLNPAKVTKTKYQIKHRGVLSWKIFSEGFCSRTLDQGTPTNFRMTVQSWHSCVSHRPFPNTVVWAWG